MSKSLSLLFLLICVTCPAQALTPGSLVVTTMGWTSGPYSPGHTISQVDPFDGTRTPLSITGYPTLAGEIPAQVVIESTHSFLLGTWVMTGTSLLTNGNVYRVAWINGGFVATQLNANTLGEGVCGMSYVANDLYFATTGQFSTGTPPYSGKLWRMPRSGGTATMVVDLTMAGVPGIGFGVVALGTTLHVFSFISTGTVPGEHWTLDTSVTPNVLARIGALPSPLRTGTSGYQFGALNAVWDARLGAFALNGVFNEVLWRDPNGNNVRHLFDPAPLPASGGTYSDYGAPGLALDSDTGTLFWGDKARHLESFRSEHDHLRLDQFALAFGSLQPWVMGIGHVPAAAHYLPEAQQGCPQSGGGYPISYCNQLPTAGNGTFACTLEATAAYALLVVGFDNVTSSFGLLPFDLSSIGSSPGCWLGVHDQVIVLTSSTTNHFAVNIPLPTLSLTAWTQWAVPDPINPLGIVVSDARRLEVR